MKRTVLLFTIFAVLAGFTACGASNSPSASAVIPEPSSVQDAASAVEEQQTGSASNLESTEIMPQETQTVTSFDGMLTEEDAKQIALEDAGVTENDLSGIYIHLDMNDGIHVYEVEFYVGTQEYDYEIHGFDGTILSKDSENEIIFPHTTAESSLAPSFSEEDAIKLVLEKVPGATEDLIRIHLDRDDGILIYEGSLVYDGVEYDFEIHGNTGAILEWEAEKQEPFDFD